WLCGSTKAPPWSFDSLRVVGRDAANYVNMGVPMPTLAISRLPLMAGMRAYARFGVVVLMTVAVLGGFGFDRFAAWLRGRAVRSGVAAVAVLIVLAVEFAPMSITMDARPTELDEWLAAQPGDGAVIWLPYEHAVGDEQMYRTIFTGKPIAFGDTSYMPQSFEESRKKLKTFPDEAALEELQVMGVRWVVVDAANLSRASKFASEEATVVATFDGIDVLELRR
ncbi:MAG: hypothetical protein U1E22_06895, partial [Coriobacteriia bacterium]|nr:hypothetical protein [Coriobacteriia bacterium]